MDLQNITGRRKAAALLISLGSELASQVLKTMREDEVELITREIVRMERLPAEMRDAILQSVYEDAMSRQFITAGGSDYARDLLARTLGTQKAGELLTKATAPRRDQPFSFMGELDATQLLPILEAEHPQTAAIMEALEHNDPELAAEVRKHMFVFEDIKSLDDRSMQRLLRDVNGKDLAMALRGATEELKNRVFKNMSSRAAQQLRDDMSVAGPVRLRLVEEGQQRIINTVKALQEAGGI